VQQIGNENENVGACSEEQYAVFGKLPDRPEASDTENGRRAVDGVRQQLRPLIPNQRRSRSRPAHGALSFHFILLVEHDVTRDPRDPIGSVQPVFLFTAKQVLAFYAGRSSHRMIVTYYFLADETFLQ
jgi:hypothetical protein